MLMNPKGSPFYIFSALSDIFQKKKIEFFQKSFFPVGEKVVSESYRAWKARFGCLETVYEHFMNTSLAYFKNFALFEP